MYQYSTNPPNDPLKQAQTDLNNVYVSSFRIHVRSTTSLRLPYPLYRKDIMVQNIDAVLARGERIELLVDKTDSMAGQAHAFRRGARNVRRQMWWKNTRIMMLSGVVCVLLLYLFVAQFCGAGLGSCRRKT
jgi:vesicle-associated membrane protein 7